MKTGKRYSIMTQNPILQAGPGAACPGQGSIFMPTHGLSMALRTAHTAIKREQ